MLFHSFENQEERKEYGGSAFLELSYCKQYECDTVKKKLKISNLPYWQNDSLFVYVDDLEAFYKEYYKVFDILGDDLYGVKYFAPEEVGKIIERLNCEKPTEFQILVNWLNFARTNNGFYILGI